MAIDELEYILEMWPLSDNTEDHLSSHHLLLQDRVRNETFRRAIRQVVRPGDLVLDIGAGTGILSAFALQAGARHVYLVESTDIISCAGKILKCSGWGRRATLLRAEAEKIRYVGRKVDVILIELIGSFGIDENILDVLVPVRDRALREGGSIIPRRLRLMAAPISHSGLERAMRVYHERRHGADLSPLAPLAHNNIYLFSFRTARFLAQPQKLIELDLVTCRQNRLDKRLDFEIERHGRLLGIVGWFEADLCEGISLSNHPHTNRTHWDQVMFPVGEPIPVCPGDAVSFRFRYSAAGAGDVWAWSGVVTTSDCRRVYRHSSQRRFPLRRVRTSTQLRIG